MNEWMNKNEFLYVFVFIFNFNFPVTVSGEFGNLWFIIIIIIMYSFWAIIWIINYLISFLLMLLLLLCFGSTLPASSIPYITMIHCYSWANSDLHKNIICYVSRVCYCWDDDDDDYDDALHIIPFDFLPHIPSQFNSKWMYTGILVMPITT